MGASDNTHSNSAACAASSALPSAHSLTLKLWLVDGRHRCVPSAEKQLALLGAVKGNTQVSRWVTLMDRHLLCNTKTTWSLGPTALRSRHQEGFYHFKILSDFYNVSNPSLFICHNVLPGNNHRVRLGRWMWIDEEQRKKIPVCALLAIKSGLLWLDHLLRL